MAAGGREAGNEVVKQKYETWKRNGNGSSWGKYNGKGSAEKMQTGRKRRERKEECEGNRNRERHTLNVGACS